MLSLDRFVVPPSLRCDVVLARGYAWGRTLLAASTLLTLLWNPADVLFAPIASGTPAPTGWSVWLFAGLPPAVGRMIAIAILLLVCSGWRPRVTGVLHWWVASALFRTATATDGGEQVAAAITLLLVPLTLLDARRSHWHPPSCAPAPSIAAECARVAASLVWLALHVQIALIYFHAGVGKMAVDDWANGTALYYWFQHGHVAMHPALWDSLGQVLFSNRVVLPLVTWSVMLFECTLAFAIFAGPAWRRALFVPAVAFHLGILLLHGITSFSITMIGVLCIYLLPVPTAPRAPR